MKVGTSAVGAERALAHSGAIAGSDAAFDALCRAYGVIRSADYGDWIEALEVLGSGAPAARPAARRDHELGRRGRARRRPRRARGHPAAAAARRPRRSALDADWDFHGVANPIDYYAVAEQYEILPAVARAAAEHPEIDGVLLNIDQSLRFQLYERDTSVLVDRDRDAARRARPGTSSRSCPPLRPTRPIT